ncbi:TonB-dependent receptor domain-containing protein [Capnocytophaga leadbetteri]|mgnify:FL=1|uniref:TonB-dependent receptor domain-containing protein n=1 Tax=Capnocytophaga leadbetteri TaxID=327575 RepID=UPI0028899F60|nr:TonB-dependent receptor [Capnocytophaga leadbetteri]
MRNLNHKIFRESGLLNNGGKALHRGIEVSGAIYPVEGLKLYRSGAIQRATIEYGMNKGNRVPYAPRYTATAGAKYQCGVGEGTLTTNVYGNFVSSQFSDLANTLEGSANGNVGLIPKFFLLNATASYSYKQWNFNLNALNLLNRKYFTTRHNAWGGIMPAATISVLGGVGYQF